MWSLFWGVKFVLKFVNLCANVVYFELWMNEKEMKSNLRKHSGLIYLSQFTLEIDLRKLCEVLLLQHKDKKSFYWWLTNVSKSVLQVILIFIFLQCSPFFEWHCFYLSIITLRRESKVQCKLPKTNSKISKKQYALLFLWDL